MNIFINGKQQTVPDEATVEEVLSLFNIIKESVVVEHNDVILQPDSYTGSCLAEGDRLEFIRFVGGG